MERRLVLRLTTALLTKLDIIRSRRADKPERDAMVMYLLEEALKDIKLPTVITRKGRRLDQPLKPHELNKLERGEWLGAYPFGYQVHTIKQRSKFSIPGVVTEHPINAPILRDLFETYATGKYSVKKLADYALKQHKHKFASSNLNEILKNPFYRGIMIWRGQEFKHNYPLLITHELFDRCQRVRLYNNKYSLFVESVPTHTKEQKTTTKPTDDFLSLFSKPILFDDLLAKTALSHDELHAKLFDYELKGLITEAGPLLWTLKK